MPEGVTGAASSSAVLMLYIKVGAQAVATKAEAVATTLHRGACRANFGFVMEAEYSAAARGAVKAGFLPGRLAMIGVG